MPCAVYYGAHFREEALDSYGLLPPCHYLYVNAVQAHLCPCLLVTGGNITPMCFALCLYNRLEEAYARVRQSFADIRKNVERWCDAVLHSVSSCVNLL